MSRKRVASLSGDQRQAAVGAWVRKVFGARVARDVNERVARLVEEVVELAQAEGMPPEQLMAIVGHVYSKEPGDPAQEVGGIRVTVLAYCDAIGLSAESEEVREIDRIFAKPRSHFRARQNAKAAAGVARRSE